MPSKAVALFLSLGLATMMAACGNTAPDGGDEGGTGVPPKSEQPSEAPAAEGTMVPKTPPETSTEAGTGNDKAGSNPIKDVPDSPDTVDSTDKSGNPPKDGASGTDSTDDDDTPDAAEEGDKGGE